MNSIHCLFYLYLAGTIGPLGLLKHAGLIDSWWAVFAPIWAPYCVLIPYIIVVGWWECYTADPKEKS